MESTQKLANNELSIVIEVTSYPTAQPKFTKKTWESGEKGGGSGEAG